jgi:hypothetical protein
VDVVTSGISFLVGVGVGAAGQYFADKYTDKRRKQEHQTDSAKRFRAVAEKMPALMAEIAADFRKENAAPVRQLVLLLSEAVTYNGGDRLVFVYYETKHPNLRGQFAILENAGYVRDVTPGNALTYRPTEEFVDHLLGYRQT